MRRRARRFLVFAPSAALGLAGAAWVLLSPPDLGKPAGPPAVLLTAAALTLALLSAAWLLERRCASFRYAGQSLERALRSLRITTPLAVTLAVVTAVSEELFFRGGVMQLAGPWGQALLFGLMHPAGRRGWAYTVFTAVSGLAFGYAALLTGSLWAPVIAHFAINLQGLLQVRRGRRSSGRARPQPGQPGGRI